MTAADSIVTFGSLFTGAGGLDLGLERAGMNCTFQVENNGHCLTLLRRHWPAVPKNEIRPCLGLVGGDPCPVRSSLSRIQRSRKPDLSGYFLAMVHRCQPRWVLRENVPAPDVVDFCAALDLLGYAGVVVAADAAAFTGQARLREFVVAFHEHAGLDRFVRACRQRAVLEGLLPAHGPAKPDRPRQALNCLISTRGRMGFGIPVVYEPGRGIRHLSFPERESLQGWPVGWTDGVPGSARDLITANGVCAPVAEWIGSRIVEALL